LVETKRSAPDFQTVCIHTELCFLMIEKNNFLKNKDIHTFKSTGRIFR